jgi:flagellar protein FliL
MKLLGILVPVIALAAGIGVGAGAALFLKPAEEPVEETQAETEAEPKAFEPAEPGQSAEFAQLGNQFVVPVVRGGVVRALVLVSVTLEVTEGGSATVHSMEPRLRDAFLQVLFDHANTGGFDDRFTQNDRMSLLRQGLREAAHRLLGPILRDVLIVDLVRQEA